MEVSGQIHDPVALLPEAGPPVSVAYGAGWAPVLSWKCRRREIAMPLSGLEPGFLGGSDRRLVITLSAVSRSSVKPCNHLNQFLLFKIVWGYSAHCHISSIVPYSLCPDEPTPIPDFLLTH